MPSGIIDGIDYAGMSKLVAKIAAQSMQMQDHVPPYHDTPAPVFNNNTTTNHNEQRGASLKVLIVGDSMTQGQEGDYTWRYRISQ